MSMRFSKLVITPSIALILLLNFFIVGLTGLYAQDVDDAPAAEAPAGLTAPRIEMQTTLDKLVDIVTTNSGDSNLDIRRSKMREAIEPKFDFEEMAKRSLGAPWRTITQAERKEFVDLFSELLARTYIGRLENVEKDMVTIQNEMVRYPRALVKTSVLFKGDKFPIDYKLLHSKEASSDDASGWRVYDVIIENIGLVSNYRNEFAGIIRKEKFSGLLARLREKNAAAEAK
jgi:phospholipid transport system substrate-binding protein